MFAPITTGSVGGTAAPADTSAAMVSISSPAAARPPAAARITFALDVRCTGSGCATSSGMMTVSRCSVSVSTATVACAGVRTLRSRYTDLASSGTASFGRAWSVVRVALLSLAVDPAADTALDAPRVRSRATDRAPPARSRAAPLRRVGMEAVRAGICLFNVLHAVRVPASWRSRVPTMLILALQNVSGLRRLRRGDGRSARGRCRGARGDGRPRRAP